MRRCSRFQPARRDHRGRQISALAARADIARHPGEVRTAEPGATAVRTAADTGRARPETGAAFSAAPSVFAAGDHGRRPRIHNQRDRAAEKNLACVRRFTRLRVSRAQTPGERSMQAATRPIGNNSRNFVAGVTMADKLNIFISYKKDDVILASAIDGIFGNFGGNRVETYIAAKLLAGAKWEVWIRDSLAKSHLLILLFTDPDQDWGWCLFEAGLFLGLDVDDHRHVVCIYQPNNEPPRPLKSIQGVPANASDILSLFKSLFRDTALTQTDTPLNVQVTDNALSSSAEEIAKLFVLRRARPESVYPELLLTFPQVTNTENATFHENGTLYDDIIVTPDTRATSLFGIADGEWRWGQLIKELDLKGSPLVDELGKAIGALARRRAPRPIAANYRSPETSTYYSPAIYRVERLDKKLVTCRVAFIPESSPIDTGGPGDAGVLFSMLRMGVRFRWEIIETFLAKLREVEAGSSTAVFSHVKNAIDVIEREGAASHFDDYENVKDVFAPSRQEAISSLYNDWKLLRTELDENVDLEDVSKVSSVLKKMRRLNQTFMAIASMQYAEVLALK
jgi:hypothetical protein